MKRIFDILLSGLLLVFACPILLLIALFVKIDSPGPIFFRANRTGKDGEHFHIFKFRSMVADASTKGPGITRMGDSRITRIGRLLRKWKLDEIPQLFNILKGEMAIVGPRPEDPKYVSQYTPEQRRVLSVRPGIASPAIIKYRNEEELLEVSDDVENTYLTLILPDKICLDLDYIDHQSFLNDLRVLGKTLYSIFWGRR